LTSPLKNKVCNLWVHFVNICYYIELQKRISIHKYIKIFYYLTWLNYFLANNGQIPIESKSQTIAGILGVVKLLIGPYIIIIKKKKFVGKKNSGPRW